MVDIWDIFGQKFFGLGEIIGHMSNQHLEALKAEYAAVCEMNDATAGILVRHHLEDHQLYQPDPSCPTCIDLSKETEASGNKIRKLQEELLELGYNPFGTIASNQKNEQTIIPRWITRIFSGGR